MAQLCYKYGTMGAGKSIEVLKTAYNYREKHKKALLFTSNYDNRYGENKIVSRIGLRERAVSISDDTNILEFLLDYMFTYGNDKPDCILIDECQFLRKHHIEELIHIVDEINIPVTCYGLKNDFKNELFEGSYWLLTLADKIEEMPSICWCGERASSNARIVNNKVVKDGEQIQIGGNESYASLCRRHYNQKKTGSE